MRKNRRHDLALSSVYIHVFIKSDEQRKACFHFVIASKGARKRIYKAWEDIFSQALYILSIVYEEILSSRLRNPFKSSKQTHRSVFYRPLHMRTTADVHAYHGRCTCVPRPMHVRITADTRRHEAYAWMTYVAFIVHIKGF